MKKNKVFSIAYPLGFCVTINGMGETEIISKAMSLIGSRKSEKKAATSAENGRKGGRPAGALKPLESFVCTCGKCPDDPKTYCPRGRAIIRRRNAAQTKEAMQQ